MTNQEMLDSITKWIGDAVQSHAGHNEELRGARVELVYPKKDSDKGATVKIQLSDGNGWNLKFTNFFVDLVKSKSVESWGTDRTLKMLEPLRNIGDV